MRICGFLLYKYTDKLNSEVVQMKRIFNPAFQVAIVWIGTMIGAGFASGKEILQFFGPPSEKGGTAIVFATFLLILICRRILTIGYNNGAETLDDYLLATGGKFAKYIKYFMLAFMFCGMAVMFAGSGALFAQTFALPPVIGILCMGAICFFVFLFDAKGIIALNSILVPIMLAGLLYISISSAMFKSHETFFAFLTEGRKFPFLSAFCYVSYNTITLSAVLIPLCRNIDRRQIRTASIAGGCIIGLLILILWTAMGMRYEHLWNSEIPMMHLAAINGKICKNLYAVILFLSICTTAVSNGFGILADRPAKSLRTHTLHCALLCLLALPFALFGFSILVENLYTFFGICGFLLCLTLLPRKKKRAAK